MSAPVPSPGAGRGTAPADGPPDVRIFRAGHDPAVQHAAGIRTTPLVGPADAAGWTCGISVYPAGAEAPMHRHNCPERIVVLGGEAELRVGDRLWQLGPHDVGWIAADVDHGYRNCGVGDLHLLWIYDRDDATRTLAGQGLAQPMLQPGVSAAPPGDSP